MAFAPPRAGPAERLLQRALLIRTVAGVAQMKPDIATLCVSSEHSMSIASSGTSSLGGGGAEVAVCTGLYQVVTCGTSHAA